MRKKGSQRGDGKEKGQEEKWRSKGVINKEEENPLPDA
jgi:hypothetical protein